MKILAFGATNNVDSINKQFAHFTANLFEFAEIELIDLNDFECPIYSPDRQKNGYPSEIISFMEKLELSDLVIISFAEYNGSYTSAFKNLFDWCSTYKGKTFESTPIILLSTSNGERGGATVLSAALDRFPRHGATILGSFSLPFFDKNFSKEFGITDNQLNQTFNELIESIKKKIFS